MVSGDGKWKLHLPHPYRTLVEAGNDGQPGRYETTSIELSLFDMENDPYETTNVIDTYPDVAERLQALAVDQWLAPSLPRQIAQRVMDLGLAVEPKRVDRAQQR